MLEIERKFLINCHVDDLKRQSIKADNWLTGHYIEQCYLGDTGEWNIRVRKEAPWSTAVNPDMTVRENWDRFAQIYITMKRRQTAVTNIEIESYINDDLYNEISQQCGHDPIRKFRWTFHDHSRFTVDEFLNPEFKGLVLAEIELTSEDEPFNRPDWLGEEVTGEKQYGNAFMAQSIRNGNLQCDKN